MSDTPSTILTIAGSDPSGGAGIQADLKTISALGGYGASVITALTAQNTVGVQGVHEVPPEFINQQLKCVLEDIPPKAIKVGMLANEHIVKVVKEALSAFQSSGFSHDASAVRDSSQRAGTSSDQYELNLVVDPVTISTSNHTLLSDSAIGELCFGLLPLARCITPNILEAELLWRTLSSGQPMSNANHVESDELPSASGQQAPKLGSLRDAIHAENGHGEKQRIRNLEDMMRAGQEILDYLDELDSANLHPPDSHLSNSGAFPANSSFSGRPRARGVLVKGGHLPVSAADIHDFLEQQSGTSKSSSAKTNKVSLIDLQHVLPDSREQSSTEVLEAHRTRTRSSPDNLSNDGEKSGPRFVVDILIDRDESGKDEVTVSLAPEVKSTSTHGTGCTLSAAIAVGLGDSLKLRDAVAQGIAYTQQGIITATPIGAGHGPLNHGWINLKRVLPLPSRINPHPFVSHLISSSREEWRAYVRHPFVLELGKGTLPRKCFQHYIIQDYHYLRHYARAHGLAAYKSDQFADIQALSEIALHVARESRMHVEFCRKFDVSEADLLSAKESPFNTAYSRYILDIGMRGDCLDLLVAVASCLIGYGEVGLFLAREAQTNGEIKLKGNPYRRWIEDYSGKEFQDAVHNGIAVLERRIAQDPPSRARLDQLTEIWRTCVNLEIGFWQMGLDCS